MRTVNRRELNHSLAQVLDEVMATGEAVEVVTRGGRPLLISVKPESTYERWVREGLVDDTPSDLEVLDSIEPVELGRPTDELLAEIRRDR